MGTTKTKGFTDRQSEIALIAKALGHPARVAIIDLLLEINACIGNDILDRIPLAQPTISQHLKILKDANLIKGTIDGNKVCYCINETSFEVLSAYFKNIAENVTHQNCC